MVKKVVIPAINSVLTVVVFGSKPNNAFNLFISYIAIIIFLYFLYFLVPFPQPNPIVFSGRTKIRKNNEECLILHVFNYTERLILHISRFQNALFYIFQGIQINKSSRVTDALNISEYSLLTNSEFPTYVRRNVLVGFFSSKVCKRLFST